LDTTKNPLATKPDTSVNRKEQRRLIFVQCSALNRKEALTYYFAIYLPNIGYPLPNCHFSLKQFHTVQAKGMRAIFPKCGFNHNNKSLILYGPSRLGGEQGIGQIQTFLRRWRCSKQPGQLLHIAVAWVQYATSNGVSFLTDVSTALPHMESKWLKSLRQFLYTINGTIEVDCNIIQPLQRIHDCYLMDSVLAHDQFTPKQVCLVHYCRVYLQVLTLSDITLANGTHLNPALYHGTKSLLSSINQLHQFRQDRHPQQLGSNGSKHVVSGANQMANCTNPLDHGYTNQISYVANGPPTKTRMVPSTSLTQMDMTSISNTMVPT
jgi:hypothetical protein